MFTLIINAGGQSRRMGRSKALLAVPPDDTPLLRYILRKLQPLANGRSLVISNDPTMAESAHLPEGVRILPDAYPAAGTLGGIATGLAATPDWAMLVACDLPLINPALFVWFQQLAAEQLSTEPAQASPSLLLDRWDAIVPVVGGYEEPLHALYHRRCLPAIEKQLLAGERRVVSFMPSVRVRYVQEEELRGIDPQLHSFFNANTPEEWEQALVILRG